MNKALILITVMALGECAGGLLGQETQKPYSYTFEESDGKYAGKCVFSGVTFDQAWDAAVKALEHLNYKTLNEAKQMKQIYTLKRAPDVFAFGPGINLIFEEREGGIGIRAWSLKGEDQPEEKEAARRAREFYDSMVEILYGKVKKE